MTTYAIGDVQGCFKELQTLLIQIKFDPNQDTLWFTGDLVNRGSQSLEVLRFIKALGNKHKIVLGNHDLHLLALHYKKSSLRHTDTLQAILEAPDRMELMAWLQAQPLLHYDAEIKFVMVHAGLAPQWDLKKALLLSQEVSAALKQHPQNFFQHMYGNDPDNWRDDLKNNERLRCITNYFTRARFCYADGRLDFAYKGGMADKPADIMPWFSVPDRKNSDSKIIFGHWAALMGHTDVPNVFPLDTGCVWGNCLTAMRLEDSKRFSVQC